MDSIWIRFLAEQSQEERQLLKTCPDYREAIMKTYKYNEFVLSETLKDFVRALVRR